jgi:hypothetical protein
MIEKNNINHDSRDDADGRKLFRLERIAVIESLWGGIAHEMNSQLSAVKSSDATIGDYLDVLYRDLPKTYASLGEGERGAFEDLINRAVTPLPPSSAREEREKKRVLDSELEAAGIGNRDSVVERLFDMGITGYSTSLAPVLASEQRDELLEIAYSASGVFRSYSNISEAAGRLANTVSALRNYSKASTPSSPSSAIERNAGSRSSGITRRFRRPPVLPMISPTCGPR